MGPRWPLPSIIRSTRRFPAQPAAYLLTGRRTCTDHRADRLLCPWSSATGMVLWPNRVSSWPFLTCCTHRIPVSFPSSAQPYGIATQDQRQRIRSRPRGPCYTCPGLVPIPASPIMQFSTYAEVATRVEAVAEQFAAMGVGRGDVVAVMLPNRLACAAGSAGRTGCRLMIDMQLNGCSTWRGRPPTVGARRGDCDSGLHRSARDLAQGRGDAGPAG
jgi:hypothetical protein